MGVVAGGRVGGSGGGGAPVVPSLSRFALQYSHAGTRSPGAALKSGGDLFGNLTPNVASGQASIAGTIREVAWGRTVTPAGFLRISVIDATQNEIAFTLVPVPDGVKQGETTGLSLAVPAGGSVAVIWDVTSSGTTQGIEATVFVEPAA